MNPKNTVQLELTLTLPASLAREAEIYRLLSPQMMESLLRTEVQRQRVNHLFEASDRLATASPAPLTAAEIEVEIEAVRAERRADHAHGC